METASFGRWVRRRRRTLDLTQAELAGRVACAPITIRKIESDERRPSKVMAERLAEALELDDEARPRFVATARATISPARLTTPAASGLFAPGGALPAPVHPLVGRDDELGEALERLAVGGGAARLLTVTGPPGVGKTRFAIEVAARALRKFDVPPVFVDLSVVDDPAMVPARIAATVATPAAPLGDATDLATHALGRIPTLLLLDNLEHLLEAADHVITLLARCPDLTVLATSRRPLDVYGEHDRALGPLPEDDALTLLVERVGALDPALAESVAGDAGRAVCAAVDGLPLALELAARRLRECRPDELVAALAGPGDLGDPLGTAARGGAPRQGSVSATLRWSYDLLRPDEQALLDRLGVFASSFDRELAAAVVARGPEPIAPPDLALEELRRQGLVRADPATGRFGLLAVVRAFARGRLAESGRLTDARAHHALAVADRADSESPGIEAWPERAEIDALAALEPDVLAALDWCFGAGADAHTGRRLVGALAPLWYFRGQVGDLLRWSTAGHDRLSADDAPDERGRAAYYLAVARWSAGDLPAATAAIHEAVAATEAAGDDVWLAECLGIEQYLSLSGGDLAGADALTDRCVVAAERAGPEWQLLAELRGALLTRLRGDLDATAGHVERAAALAPRSGTFAGAMARAAAADLANDRGDVAAAVDGYLAAAVTFLEIDAELHAVARVAGVATALAHPATDRTDLAAATICGVVDAWCEHLGAPLHPLAAIQQVGARLALADRMGAGFDDAVKDGASLPHGLDTVKSLVSNLTDR